MSTSVRIFSRYGERDRPVANPVRWMEKVDPDVYASVPAAGVVGEAMVAIVLARAMPEKFGGDSLGETHRNFEAYQKTIGPRGA